jgi:hypothetical protein
MKITKSNKIQALSIKRDSRDCSSRIRKEKAPVLQGLCDQQQIHVNLLKIYHQSTTHNPAKETIMSKQEC